MKTQNKYYREHMFHFDIGENACSFMRYIYKNDHPRGFACQLNQLIDGSSSMFCSDVILRMVYGPQEITKKQMKKIFDAWNSTVQNKYNYYLGSQKGQPY